MRPQARRKLGGGLVVQVRQHTLAGTDSLRAKSAAAVQTVSTQRR